MATNSAGLRASAPCKTRRSRGRSLAGWSLSRMPVMRERLYGRARRKHAKSEPPAKVGGRSLELPPFKARKSEIRNSKPETNPKHQAGNDPNHYTAGGSWPWIIGHLNLFRISGFEFRIWDHSARR